MKTAAWATDVHFDHLPNEDAIRSFCKTLQGADYVFLTGDISTGDKIVEHMELIVSEVGCPVFFVCGNHDFYRSSISSVRNSLTELSSRIENLTYLTTSGFKVLSEKTAIVGHDGWYDMGVKRGLGRITFIMTDWSLIDEFANTVSRSRYENKIDGSLIVAVSSKLAHDAALFIVNDARAAIAQGASHVIVLTHVPPWTDVHFHNGKQATDEFHPYFTSEVIGDQINDLAFEHPDVEFSVFAGHTHGKVSKKISDNVMCFVQGADYGHPSHERIVLK